MQRYPSCHDAHAWYHAQTAARASTHTACLATKNSSLSKRPLASRRRPISPTTGATKIENYFIYWRNQISHIYSIQMWELIPPRQRTWPKPESQGPGNCNGYCIGLKKSKLTYYMEIISGNYMLEILDMSLPPENISKENVTQI